MNEFGPTVYEYAWLRLSAIRHEISKLNEESRACVQRMKKYRTSTMLESERIATEAEPFQTTQLPE